ncbi:hypothetical protein [Acidisoma silvae]|uniref:Uncharacterized protein n=1 Tax=Acidisoma silvae TaxID=2802396 RepID=A0A963YQK4_9PROT|nr:hypothetical protein [Acidisoma silvae]MCB8875134.1 hypothetical protein [Acidisoma silvae]
MTLGSLSDLLSAHYGYGYHHGWTDWLGHTIASGIIHALIYSFIFRLMHHLTLGQAGLLVLAVLVVMFLLAHAGDRRRW